MPFAIDLAQSKGWSYGLTWQSAKMLIGNPGAATDAISAETMNFLTSRNLDANLGADLVQMGAHEINSFNKAKAYSATGNFTAMGWDDPFVFGYVRAFKSLASISITTADGFLFGGIEMKAPMDISVQRFGQMSFGKSDFWGLRIGTSKFANRTFATILPEWNPLTQYTSGIIPKGTPFKFGIIGPQGFRYPGGVISIHSKIFRSNRTNLYMFTKMIELEDPIQFKTLKKEGKVSIEYINLIEICQGGPEIGKVLINGTLISNDFFGGPFLFYKNYIFLPIFVRKMFKRGFKLATINIETKKIEIFQNFKTLIFLSKIENNKVSYYTDINKQNIEVLELPDGSDM